MPKVDDFFLVSAVDPLAVELACMRADVGFKGGESQSEPRDVRSTANSGTKFKRSWDELLDVPLIVLGDPSIGARALTLTPGKKKKRPAVAAGFLSVSILLY